MTGPERPDPFRVKPPVGRIPDYTFESRRPGAATTGAPGEPVGRPAPVPHLPVRLVDGAVAPRPIVAVVVSVVAALIETS